jgi:hypothetical protein
MPRSLSGAKQKRSKALRLRVPTNAAELVQKYGSPLEFLLRVMKGEEIDMEFPTLAQRIYAANSVAPYLHAKLVSVEQKTEIQVDNVISAKPLTATEWAQKYTGQTIEINPVQAAIDAEAIATARGDDDDDEGYDD